MTADLTTIHTIQTAPYVTVKLAATITGLTAKAIYNKIHEGKWIEGREFRRSPDGTIFISIKGFVAWIESAREYKPTKSIT